MEELLEELRREKGLSPYKEPKKRVSRVTVENQLKVGAAWFFLIAGISVIGSTVNLITGNLDSLVTYLGLGTTYTIAHKASVIARNLPETGGFVRLSGFLLALLVAGLFGLFGILGRKGHQWAIIVGILVYIFDGYLWFREQNVMAFFYHIIVLVGLVRGLLACRQLKAIGGKGIFMAGNNATAAKQKEGLLSWLKFVIPGIPVLLLPYWIFQSMDSSGSGAIFMLVTPIFIVTATLNWTHLKTFQRHGFRLLIGWQLLMLAIVAYFDEPLTLMASDIPTEAAIMTALCLFATAAFFAADPILFIEAFGKLKGKILWG